MPKLFRSLSIPWQKLLLGLAYCAIFAFAAWLRFQHLNWDEGHFFHPDERNIAAAVSRLDVPQQINPEFYAYNGFPLYLIDISSQLVAWLSKKPSWETDWNKINQISRAYSAAFSLLSVFLVSLLARRLFKAKTALLLTFLAATTVGLIQYAHYGVTESLLVFEILCLSLLSWRYYRYKKFRDLWLMAFVCGIGLGTKTSAITFLLFPALSVFLRFGFQWKTLLSGLPVLLISGLTFFFVSPNTILFWPKFLESMHYEGGVVDGSIPVPYTMQFIDTTPYLFQLKNLLWQSSPLFLGFAFFGLLLFCRHPKKWLALWPLLFYSFAYFGYVGSWYTKFIRYMLPIFPAVILLLGLSLEWFLKRSWGKWLVTLLLLSQLFWALAYSQIFLNRSSRLVATDWIYQNIPSGSRLLTEHWDDGLPSESRASASYQQIQLKLYDADTPSKMSTLAKSLAQGDYLIISSRRLTGSLTRNPDYPYSKHYYELLFAGKLGYQKVQQITAYPQLLGVVINDDASEETFQVYDHPVIQIFANTKKLSAEQLQSLLLNLESY